MFICSSRGRHFGLGSAGPARLLFYSSYLLVLIFKSLLTFTKVPWAKFTRPSPDSGGGEIYSASWWKEQQTVVAIFGHLPQSGLQTDFLE